MRAEIHGSQILKDPRLDGNLAQLAERLVEAIGLDVHSLQMREQLGDERMAVISTLVDFLKQATQREVGAWRARVLREEIPKALDSDDEIESVQQAVAEEPPLDVDAFERVLSDLEGLLELYLQSES